MKTLKKTTTFFVSVVGKNKFTKNDIQCKFYKNDYKENLKYNSLFVKHKNALILASNSLLLRSPTEVFVKKI